MLTPEEQANALERLFQRYEGELDSSSLALLWKHPELSALMPTALLALASHRYQAPQRTLDPAVVSAWRESLSTSKGLRAAFREGYLQGSPIFFAPCFTQEEPGPAHDRMLAELRSMFDRFGENWQRIGDFIERAVAFGVPVGVLLVFARQLWDRLIGPSRVPDSQGLAVHVLRGLLGSSDFPQDELEPSLARLVAFCAKFYEVPGAVWAGDFEEILRRIADPRLAVEAQERLLTLLFEKGVPAALWHASHVLMDAGLSRVALARLSAARPETYLNVIPALSDALVAAGSGELVSRAARVERALARRPSVDEAAFDRGVRRFLPADPETYWSGLVQSKLLLLSPSPRPAEQLVEESKPTDVDIAELMVSDELRELPEQKLSAFFERIRPRNPELAEQAAFVADVIRGVKFDELRVKYADALEATASLDWRGADRARSRGEDAALECLLGTKQGRAQRWDGFLLAAAKTQSLCESARRRLLSAAETPSAMAALWASPEESLDFAGPHLERRFEKLSGWQGELMLVAAEPVLADSRLSPTWIRSIVLSAVDAFIADKQSASTAAALVALVARVLSARGDFSEDDRAVLRSAADEVMNRATFGTPIEQARHDQARADWAARAASAEFTARTNSDPWFPGCLRGFRLAEDAANPSAKYSISMSNDAKQWSSKASYSARALDERALNMQWFWAGPFELPPLSAPPVFRPFGAE